MMERFLKVMFYVGYAAIPVWVGKIAYDMGYLKALGDVIDDLNERNEKIKETGEKVVKMYKLSR